MPAHNNTAKQAQYLVTFGIEAEDDLYWSKHTTDCYNYHAYTSNNISLQTSKPNFFPPEIRRDKFTACPHTGGNLQLTN